MARLPQNTEAGRKHADATAKAMRQSNPAYVCPQCGRGRAIKRQAVTMEWSEVVVFVRDCRYCGFHDERRSIPE